MNKAVLVGRLTKDPELSFAQGTGMAICKFTIAVNRRFKKEGQPEADFLPVTVFGKTGEATANYMVKGSQISVSGSIQTSNYMNKDNVRTYKTEIIADEVDFLDSKKKDNNSSNSNSNQGSNSNTSNAGAHDFGSDVTPIDDGDIPF